MHLVLLYGDMVLGAKDSKQHLEVRKNQEINYYLFE